MRLDSNNIKASLRQIEQAITKLERQGGQDYLSPKYLELPNSCPSNPGKRTAVSWDQENKALKVWDTAAQEWVSVTLS